MRTAGDRERHGTARHGEGWHGRPSLVVGCPCTQFTALDDASEAHPVAAGGAAGAMLEPVRLALPELAGVAAIFRPCLRASS